MVQFGIHETASFEAHLWTNAPAGTTSSFQFAILSCVYNSNLSRIFDKNNILHNPRATINKKDSIEKINDLMIATIHINE